MKNIFIAVAVLAVGWFIYSGQSKAREAVWTFEGETIRAEKANNIFVFSDNGDARADVRLFGFNTTPMGEAEMGPFVINTHMFVMAPMEENAEIFRTQFCEKASFDKAVQVNVIAADDFVFDRVEEIRANAEERQCARLSGKSLVLEQEFYEGEDLMGQFTASSDTPWDWKKFILLTDIALQPCD